MESVTGALVFIKMSPLFLGIGIVFVIGLVLGLLLYMKKRNK